MAERAICWLGMAAVLMWPGICGAEGSTGPVVPLILYSPAPPAIMLHEHNLELGAALERCGIENDVTAVPLPQSINRIAAMETARKAFHLPIVTTVDFLSAVRGGGPAWHAYDQANPDLRLVAALYDVAFGVLALDAEIESPRDLRGRKIGAPPRPSAVRLLTEALLRDGWGIIDEVEIVDIRPPELMQAVAEGRIDATTWNLMSLTASGFVPLVPPLLESPGAHWVHVDEAAVAALADAGKLQVDTVQVGSQNEPGSDKPGTVTLLSFKQALAAWESTPTVVVNTILECLEGVGATSAALPSGVDAMLDWPMSDDGQLHAAAREFHRRRGALRERPQDPVIDR